MTAPAARLGVFGGSGLYAMPGLEGAAPTRVDTPFGPPSEEIVTGRLDGVPVAFLARHGAGHRLLPTEINFRANVWAFKSLGVEFIVSASAVGSLAEAVHPLDVVVPDQFIDRTRHRSDTFFGEGLAAHVSLADPVCGTLTAELADAAEEAGGTVHRTGTYVCMEGPQFSTRAESEMYRGWGAAVIGMTNLQEARLAREAEICYASLSLVTDYDCWKTDEEPVTVEAVVDRLHRNAELAARTVRAVTGRLPAARGCGCATALDAAIVTHREAVPESTIRRLGPVVARVFGRGGA